MQEPKVDISFSTSAESLIQKFLDAARSAHPEACAYIPFILFPISSSFTDRKTGETTKKGPQIGIGLDDPKTLTNEIIVRLKSGLTVAVDLPPNLEPPSRIAFDVADGYLIVPGMPPYDAPPKRL